MTDFLLFIGPYKCLAYGAAFGFVVGAVFGAWSERFEGRKKQ